MIDLRLLRDDPEALRASQRARGESEAVVDDLLRADEERRARWLARRVSGSSRSSRRSITQEAYRPGGEGITPVSRSQRFQASPGWTVRSIGSAAETVSPLTVPGSKPYGGGA